MKNLTIPKIYDNITKSLHKTAKDLGLKQSKKSSKLRRNQEISEVAETKNKNCI